MQARSSERKTARHDVLMPTIIIKDIGCARAAGQLQHFGLMTYCPTTGREGWSLQWGACWATTNQPLWVCLSVCYSSIGIEKMRNGEGKKKKGWEGLVAHWMPLTLGPNRQTQKERDRSWISFYEMFPFHSGASRMLTPPSSWEHY